ncbi:MAG: NmrA/HSCARG family protein [Novosphingobium sp.]
MTDSRAVLVTGATGMQGGAAVDALLEAGFAVRALTREPQSPAAQALAARGVGLAQGGFDDVASLTAAMAGAHGVFSMQNVSPADDPGAEVRHGRNLLTAAHEAGITAFIHTSVARAGDQTNFADWTGGGFLATYWNGKSGVNDLVRASGLPQWTVLKPAYMLDNFVPPKAAWMYPGLVGRVIETAMTPDARLDVLAAADVGRFAVAALLDPARFSGQEIDLAAASVTMTEVADAISAATGQTVTARSLAADELVAKGYSPGLVNNQLWANTEGYRVDLARAASFGIAFETLEQWARRNAGRFHFND